MEGGKIKGLRQTLLPDIRSITPDNNKYIELLKNSLISAKIYKKIEKNKFLLKKVSRKWYFLRPANYLY